MSVERKILASQRQPAYLVLETGHFFQGYGVGAKGKGQGHLCFHTGLSGFQEIVSDPSYAGELIVFTYPHIGNTGANPHDIENGKPACAGIIMSQFPTSAANWRANQDWQDWLVANQVTGIVGIDTRLLTRLVRDHGIRRAMIVHEDKLTASHREEYQAEVQQIADLAGQDLAERVSSQVPQIWSDSVWDWSKNTYPKAEFVDRETPHIVAIDFGAKHNILRELTARGCRVKIMPAKSSYAEIMAQKPDGIFLSNGPGDPAATSAYAVPLIQKLLAENLPIFGICLGHQLLARALGGTTEKMHHGHHGANHPVRSLDSGEVMITSQNHNFAVSAKSLPDHVRETHISLFDGSNEGLALKDRPVFSVQFHPESSPGPHDAKPLFDRFVDFVQEQFRSTSINES